MQGFAGLATSDRHADPGVTAAGASALVIGEALIDIVARAGRAPVELPGGSPMNVAIGLGRLGHPTTLATWLGRDARGAAIVAHLAHSGVTLLPGSDGADHTPTALATVDATGHATYRFDLVSRLPPLRAGADASEPPGATPPGTAMPGAPAVVHVGSISTVVEPAATAIEHFLAELRGRTTISFDPNCRPSIIGPVDEVRPRVERLVAAADLVKVSDEDLAWLYPGDDPQDQAIRWLGLGPRLVVVTRGSQGASAVTRGAAAEVPADATVVVADTVGAGDAFTAGLLHALWRRDRLGSPDRLDGLTVADLEQVLAVATRVADITVSRPGADPPWLTELTPEPGGEPSAARRRVGPTAS